MTARAARCASFSWRFMESCNMQGWNPMISPQNQNQNQIKIKGIHRHAAVLCSDAPPLPVPPFVEYRVQCVGLCRPLPALLPLGGGWWLGGQRGPKLDENAGWWACGRSLVAMGRTSTCGMAAASLGPPHGARCVLRPWPTPTIVAASGRVGLWLPFFDGKIR